MTCKRNRIKRVLFFAWFSQTREELRILDAREMRGEYREDAIAALATLRSRRRPRLPLASPNRCIYVRLIDSASSSRRSDVPRRSGNAGEKVAIPLATDSRSMAWDNGGRLLFSSLLLRLLLFFLPLLLLFFFFFFFFHRFCFPSPFCVPSFSITWKATWRSLCELLGSLSRSSSVPLLSHLVRSDRLAPNVSSGIRRDAAAPSSFEVQWTGSISRSRSWYRATRIAVRYVELITEMRQLLVWRGPGLYTRTK